MMIKTKRPRVPTHKHVHGLISVINEETILIAQQQFDLVDMEITNEEEDRYMPTSVMDHLLQ